MKLLPMLSVAAVAAAATFAVGCDNKDAASNDAPAAKSAGSGSTVVASARPPAKVAPTAPASTAAATPAPAAGGDTKTVDLAPLPLTLKMPKGEAAVTMDKSFGGSTKIVGVSFDAVWAGLNVSLPSEKTLAEVKTGAKQDTMLFPFTRWVTETPTTAVEEFTQKGGKSGFIAYSWKTIGGKGYLCQSAGPAGLKSADDAAKVLAVCDTLAAK